MDSASATLDGSIRLFKYYKMLTKKTVNQLTDEELHHAPSAELNSVAILMKHITGNMMSLNGKSKLLSTLYKFNLIYMAKS